MSDKRTIEDTIILDDDAGQAMSLSAIRDDVDQDQEPAPKTAAWLSTGPHDVDWLLERLVTFSNTGVILPITLHASGAIVTGNLIGGSTYLDLMAEYLGSSVSDPAMQEITDFIGNDILEAKKLYSGPALSKSKQPFFLHLKDARFLTPGMNLNTGLGGLWRGRLSHISGFQIGSYAPN